MKRNNQTGSHLFFLEFIIVLFFFLIVSTVCLRLFARAHGITQRADALSHAQAAAASVAAVVEDLLSNTSAENVKLAVDKSAQTVSGNAADNSFNKESLLQAAAEYFPGASLSALPDDIADQKGLVVFYNKEFQTCTADDAHYLLTAAITSDGQEETLAISVTDYDHDPIYELSVTLHRPMTRKEALQ